VWLEMSAHDARVMRAGRRAGTESGPQGHGFFFVPMMRLTAAPAPLCTKTMAKLIINEPQPQGEA
jgi:hypothetical protein